MGREIRMVPPNWEHPTEERYNPLKRCTETGYKPLYDSDAEEDFAEWQAEYAKWLAGEFEETLRKHPDLDYKADEPYRAFCSWHGQPPDPDTRRPKWPEGSATWVQVYETVSEGTPVTPPFSTREELIDYLAANGDFWDQKRRAEGRTHGMECGPWKRENAEKFVNSGWAPSMMVEQTAAGTTIKAPRDGI